MDCPNSQPLDPRVKRTRKLLQDALRNLLHEKSFADISVLDIAERSTVNRATFYAHFEDKHALLTSVLRSDFEEVVSRKLERCVTFSHENVCALALAIYEFMEIMYDRCPKAAHEMETFVGPVVQHSVYCLILFWAEKDSPIPSFRGYSIESLATAISWTTFGGAVQWVRSDRKVSAAKHSGELVSLLFRPAA